MTPNPGFGAQWWKASVRIRPPWQPTHSKMPIGTLFIC